MSYDGDGNPTGIATTQNGTDQTDQDQTLTWNATGQLNTLDVGNHTSSYGYDPDGNLIARTDDHVTTLFLGDDQITLNSSGATTSVVRSYSLPGAPTVLRTATAGQTGTTLDYQSADPQGTATTDITADDLTVTHREYTPFGEDRGTPPTTWPGDKGFAGGTVDATTGLTNLGAREYDPSLGRFINPDSLLDTNDPQQWNGYAYSNNDPVNASDPTGKMYNEAYGPPPACSHDCGRPTHPKPSTTGQGNSGAQSGNEPALGSGILAGAAVRPYIPVGVASAAYLQQRECEVSPIELACNPQDAVTGGGQIGFRTLALRWAAGTLPPSQVFGEDSEIAREVGMTDRSAAQRTEITGLYLNGQMSGPLKPYSIGAEKSKVAQFRGDIATGDVNMATAALGSYTSKYEVLRSDSQGIQVRVTIRDSLTVSSLTHIITGYGTWGDRLISHLNGPGIFGGFGERFDMTVKFREVIRFR